jgi:hypothetical protein
MCPPISALDLRMSEEIDGHGDRRGTDTTAVHREPVGAGR